MITFSSYSLTINALLLAVAPVIVRIAGARIARYADAVCAKTGLGHALMGLAIGRGALTSAVPNVTVLLQGAIIPLFGLRGSA